VDVGQAQQSTLGDPREELAVVWMTQTPGSARGKYQRMIRAMVNEAITD